MFLRFSIAYGFFSTERISTTIRFRKICSAASKTGRSVVALDQTRFGKAPR
jgi:hypothetical protein